MSTASHSRLLLAPGYGERFVVHPGPVRAAEEVRRLSGIHRTPDAGQPHGVGEERFVKQGQGVHRQEAGALLRLHAHQEALLPPQKVKPSATFASILKRLDNHRKDSGFLRHSLRLNYSHFLILSLA